MSISKEINNCKELLQSIVDGLELSSIDYFDEKLEGAVKSVARITSIDKTNVDFASIQELLKLLDLTVEKAKSVRQSLVKRQSEVLDETSKIKGYF